MNDVSTKTVVMNVSDDATISGLVTAWNEALQPLEQRMAEIKAEARILKAEAELKSLHFWKAAAKRLKDMGKIPTDYENSNKVLSYEQRKGEIVLEDETPNVKSADDLANLIKTKLGLSADAIVTAEIHKQNH